MKKEIGMKSNTYVLKGVLALMLGCGAAQAALMDGMQGYWSFDDGTAADSSGNANHGVVTGLDAVSGIVGGAFDFEANDPDDHVRIPNSATMENITEGSYTMSLWIKPETRATGTQLFIKTGDHEGLRLWSYERPLFDHQEATAKQSLISTKRLDAGVWVHVLATLDRSTREMNVYADGVWTVSATYAADDVAKDYGQTEFIMGMADMTGEGRLPFDGLMDEVAIWNRAISAEEVSDVYDLGIAGQSIPEPATIGFMAMASVGMIFIRRKFSL